METPILQAAGSVLNGYATTPVGVINAALEKAKPPFIPTPFQRAILDALKDKALRTNAIAVRLKDRRRFFREKEELETQGLLLHHARLGFYRPDAPPPELKSRSKKMASEFRTWMTS
jgi:histidinol-phosphate/aromatic aminotransferase/cobyric acid decarboxylase-like protein